jgi:hypothetical protein
VLFYNKLYYFTTPHQLGKKEKPSVFLSRQFSASLNIHPSREAQNCRDKKTEGFSFFNVAKEW